MHYKIFCFLIALVGFKVVLSQPLASRTVVNLTAVVVDSTSNEIIPFATVFNSTQQTGTISDKYGLFELNEIKINDLIQVSFIGYKKRHFLAREMLSMDTVYLQQHTQMLEAVNIYADNSYLYKLLQDSKKTKSTTTKTAKTYYALQSFYDQEMVELVESYYNGSYSGYNIETLGLKNGRIALAPFHNNYFVSQESSRAVYMHKLFGKNEYFPSSPFQLPLKKLKKLYNLQLISKYKDENNSSIYVVSFDPKEQTKEYFSGKVWINFNSKHIVKVQLTIQNAKSHPFIDLAREKLDSITQINLDITKTYQNIEGKAYTNSITFNYQIANKRINDSRHNIHTEVVLYAYDYNQEFILPKFDFTSGSNEDYKKISVSPYNTFFWENIDEFGMKALKEQNETFVTDRASATSQTLFNIPIHENGNQFFGFPYTQWSKNRIRIKENVENLEKYAGLMPSDRYNLEVQIYMDINQLNDSLNVVTKTIFDPYKTFYHFAPNNEGLAFINLYFDWTEIQRRKLQQQLVVQPTQEKMIAVYHQFMKSMKVESQLYFQEVDRGTNQKEMIKWNALVREALKIDNLELFQVYK